MYVIRVKRDEQKISVSHYSKTIKVTHVGIRGVQGEPGEGVPAGGNTGQLLAKASNADYDLEYIDSSGSGAVDSVNGKIGEVVLDADDISDASTDHKFVTAGDLTKLGNLSGVNTGDQDLSGLATDEELELGYLGGAKELSTNRVSAHADGFNTALDGIAAHLTQGYGVASIGMTSDSTGADPGVGNVHRWFYQFAQLVKAAYPDVYIRYRRHDFSEGGSQQWQAPVVLNAPAGVERVHWSHPGTSNQSPYFSMTPELAGEDLDISVEMARANWTPSVVGSIAGRANGSTYDWQFSLNADGTLRIRWWQSTSVFTTATSTVAVSNPGAGVPKFVRVKLDANTGAGWTVNFYTSTNGFNWSLLGTTLSNAIPKAIQFTPGSSVYVGSGNGGSTTLTGDYYEIWLRGCIDGPLIAPISPQDWDAYSSAIVKGNLVGGLQLDFWNAAWPGQNISDTFDNVTRAPMMIADFNCLAWFFNTSHNDGQLVGAKLLNAWDQMIANHKSYLPKATLIAINQNPSVATSVNMPSHPNRLNQLTAAFYARGIPMIDTYRVFMEDGRPWDELITGEHHPIDTNDGSPANPVLRQAQIVFNALQASAFAVRNPDEMVRG